MTLFKVLTLCQRIGAILTNISYSQLTEFGTRRLFANNSKGIDSMKRFAAGIVLSLGIFQITAYAGGSSSAGGTEAFSIVGANNQFGNALVKTVAQAALEKDPNQNVFISPLSAAMALQMLLNGSDSKSATYVQIANVLGLSDVNLVTINSSSKALLAQLQNQAGQTRAVPFTLTIANSLWGNSDHLFAFNPNFVSSLLNSYQAKALTADFNSQEALDAINHWASQESNGKISNIIDAPTLSALDFSLLNATYFKANWETQFNPNETSHAQSFVQGDRTSVSVEMMNAHLYGYSETPRAQVMEMPYSGGSVSMVVVLPKAGSTLNDVIEDAQGPLSPGFWAQRVQARAQIAQFSMPKIKMSYQVNLIPTLRTLGVSAVFGDGADLSLLGGVNEKIGLVQQNSFLKVDEAGTEAAAVTIIGGGAGAVAPIGNIPVMRVDHPFLLSIVDRASGSVLFAGVISSPR